MELFLTLLLGTGLVFLGVIVVERSIAVSIAWLAPYLPDDFAGPDGFLVDTRDRQGVFDHRMFF